MTLMRLPTAVLAPETSWRFHSSKVSTAALGPSTRRSPAGSTRCSRWTKAFTRELPRESSLKSIKSHWQFKVKWSSKDHPFQPWQRARTKYTTLATDALYDPCSTKKVYRRRPHSWLAILIRLQTCSSQHNLEGYSLAAPRMKSDFGRLSPWKNC